MAHARGAPIKQKHVRKVVADGVIWGRGIGASTKATDSRELTVARRGAHNASARINTSTESVGAHVIQGDSITVVAWKVVWPRRVAANAVSADTRSVTLTQRGADDADTQVNANTSARCSANIIVGRSITVVAACAHRAQRIAALPVVARANQLALVEQRAGYVVRDAKVDTRAHTRAALV